MLTVVIADWRLDWRFANEAVKVEGKFSAMRYYEPPLTTKNPQRFSGYYLDVSYIVGTQEFVFKAGDPGPLKKDKAQWYINFPVTVLYLPEDPSKARLPRWHVNRSWDFVWTIVFAMSVLSLLVLNFMNIWASIQGRDRAG